MNRGVWSTLELLSGSHPPAAVLAEWQDRAGGEFASVSSFLRPTQRLAREYPCLGDPDCGCRHEIEELDDGRWMACCRCGMGDCPPAWLEPRDLVVHELDAVRFGGAVARTLGFEPAENRAVSDATRKIWPVGTYAVTRSPVYLGIFPSETQMIANIEGLAGSRPEPFLLLAPTANLRSAVVDSILARLRCGFIPLARCIAPDGPGRFGVISPIQPILDRFAAGLNGQQSIAPVLEGIRRELAAVRDDRRNLGAAKARLESMHGEGLFGFASKIDREARELFLAILAGGDIAKASRELGLKDSTLRSKIALWRKRGKAYVALAEFVRWRKAIKGQAGVEFAKRLVSGGERDVDFPSLIRDVVEELETLDPENWEDKCNDLAEALRAAVS